MNKIVIYCGLGGNRKHAERLNTIITSLNARLRIISEWEPGDNKDIEYIKWDLKTYRDKIRECDVAIAPQDVTLQPAKSAVKILMYMSLGVPVVASPLPAYKEIIVNDHNGYLAENDQQWQDYINILLNCTDEFRQRIINNAYSSIVENGSAKMIKKWAELINKVSIGETN